jgi:hypothetical protein
LFDYSKIEQSSTAVPKINRSQAVYPSFH